MGEGAEPVGLKGDGFLGKAALNLAAGECWEVAASQLTDGLMGEMFRQWKRAALQLISEAVSYVSAP